MSDNLLNIVSFVGSDWKFARDAAWDATRPHHEALGKYSRLLCIEPPITIDTPLRKPGVFWEWLTGSRGLRQLSDTLWLYKPLALVPYRVSFELPWLKWLNKVLMRASINGVLKKLDMRDVVLKIESPMHDYLIGMLGERSVWYEIRDDYVETFSRSPAARRRIMSIEGDVLKQADIVIVGARSMLEKKGGLNANTHFVPTAADIGLFTESLDPATQIPSELLQIKEPRIGLIGHIDDLHTDIELFNYLAERHPEWSIIAIGDMLTNAQRSFAYTKWQSLPNIHHLGRKGYVTLPGYLKGLDVCLLPYKINSYTASLYPNKLFQYLAGGKPVVSTDLPEMKPYGEVIFIARDHAEFEKLVEEALEDHSPERVAQRIAVARENSVDKRAQEKIGLLKLLYDVKVHGVR